MNKVFFSVILAAILLAVCYSQDLQPCPENPIVLTGNSFPQFIYSPYDERNNYPPNTDCRFILSARSANRRIHATVLESELEEPVFTDCKDYVSVKDGNQPTSHEVVRWCGQKYPQSFTSSSTALYIHFHSDSVVQKRGFNISFIDFELPGCPPDWLAYENLCYKLFLLPHGATWIDAQKECSYERSNLVTFSHTNDYSFILEKYTYSHTFPWIGYNDAEDEGHFQSVDTTELIWPENFPEFQGDHATKDCVYLDFTLKESVAYALDDCRNKHSFICKKESDGTTVPIAPPTNLIHHGLEEAGFNITTWLIIIILILILIIILIFCYMQYRKRANNRVANLDQNQRLVAGASTSSVTTSKTHTHSKGSKDNHAVAAGGSASHHKSNHKSTRQNSEDKNKIKVIKASDSKAGEAANMPEKVDTDSPRFNMAANQPGAITVFNSQHVDHLAQEQREHEKQKAAHHDEHHTVIHMPSGSSHQPSSHVVETVIEEKNGNIEVENTIKNHVIATDKGQDHYQDDHDEHHESVSVVNEEVVEDALNPALPADGAASNLKFPHPVAVQTDETQTTTVISNTGLQNHTNAITTTEDKTAMTDPASASILSDDFDGIQMLPMNPHTLKRRRSHIHILSNVHAKTPEEFWESA